MSEWKDHLAGELKQKERLLYYGVERNEFHFRSKHGNRNNMDMPACFSYSTLTMESKISLSRSVSVSHRGWPHTTKGS